MGRKGNWLSSIKKALSPSSKEKRSQKSRKNAFADEKASEPPVASIAEPVNSHQLPPPEEVKPIEVEDEQQTKHAYSVAVAAAAAAEAAVAAEAAATAAQAAAESVRLAELTRYSGKSKEEVAGIKIQTAFRGYLARRALRALRGLVRLKTLVEGPAVKRQTTNTLKCMQNLSRVQSQINSRRIRMSEENQALQKQLLQKRAKEIESLQMGDEWNDSLQSKEEIEAKLLSKYEATMRRERAMAYSFSHQQPWKKSSRATNLLFMDPTNPQWGWSWLERYMAARPWETRGEKDPGNDHASVRSGGISITGSEIAKSYARHQLNSTPSTPQSKAGIPIGSRKFKPVPSPRGLGSGPDDDSRSVFSVQSEKNRRHSIAGSSVRDDESLASSPSIPSYMAPTKSAKAKSRGQSPLGPVEMNDGNTPEKGTGLNAKKRLSFPASPARPRRHSGPPRVGSSVAIGVEQNASTGVVS
ncbi:protein IQ-DOMAIN 1-like [Cynara cardunculus var. scolymus]|uniref:protein IQ-DOMAIN 1-like n=1 Tax=Cynara cardunculus var. scolymus TaxID=59895 RepID=UPI000D62F3EB|nr:protein IQ-DOMAIN 1-like [Cynara cardunculus var. scolymus]